MGNKIDREVRKGKPKSITQSPNKGMKITIKCATAANTHVCGGGCKPPPQMMMWSALVLKQRIPADADDSKVAPSASAAVADIQRVIFNARFAQFCCVRTVTFAIFEGPRCSLRPFLHYSDIETQTVSKNGLLGLQTKLIIVAVSSILGAILLQAWD